MRTYTHATEYRRTLSPTQYQAESQLFRTIDMREQIERCLTAEEYAAWDEQAPQTVAGYQAAVEAKLLELMGVHTRAQDEAAKRIAEATQS